MAWSRKAPICFAAALALAPVSSGRAEAVRVDTIRDVVATLKACRRPPRRSNVAMDITVRVSFTRDGDILGHPKLTYETEQASDNDRLLYRIAVMDIATLYADAIYGRTERRHRRPSLRHPFFPSS